MGKNKNKLTPAQADKESRLFIIDSNLKISVLLAFLEVSFNL